MRDEHARLIVGNTERNRRIDQRLDHNEDKRRPAAADRGDRVHQRFVEHERAAEVSKSSSRLFERLLVALAALRASTVIADATRAGVFGITRTIRVRSSVQPRNDPVSTAATAETST